MQRSLRTILRNSIELQQQVHDVVDGAGLLDVAVHFVQQEVEELYTEVNDRERDALDPAGGTPALHRDDPAGAGAD